MSPKEFCTRFPLAYHMAEVNTWEKIKKHGLLSTSALLDLFEITGKDRFRIESQHRSTSFTIQHPNLGTAVIRDQKPMSDQSLQKCLTDMTPQEWYELLNHKVFFWLTRPRLLSLLNARAYRNRDHYVLTLGTRPLIETHLNSVSLSPMNSGCTRPRPWPRGSQTFQPFSGYPFAERINKHLQIAVELAVENRVADIATYVTRVEHMRGGSVLKIVYDHSS